MRLVRIRASGTFTTGGGDRERHDGENRRADRVISRCGKTLYGQSIEGAGPGDPDPRAVHAASSAAVAHRQ